MKHNLFFFFKFICRKNRVLYHIIYNLSSFINIPTEEEIVDNLVQLLNMRSPAGYHEYALLKQAFPSHRILEPPSAPGAMSTVAPGFAPPVPVPGAAPVGGFGTPPAPAPIAAPAPGSFGDAQAAGMTGVAPAAPVAPAPVAAPAAAIPGMPTVAPVQPAPVAAAPAAPVVPTEPAAAPATEVAGAVANMQAQAPVAPVAPVAAVDPAAPVAPGDPVAAFDKNTFLNRVQEMGK